MSKENERYPGLWEITNHLVQIIDVIAKDFNITTQEASKLVGSAIQSTPMLNRIKKSVEKTIKEGPCTPS
jgi:hypothetical protein